MGCLQDFLVMTSWLNLAWWVVVVGFPIVQGMGFNPEWDARERFVHLHNPLPKLACMEWVYAPMYERTSG